MRRAGLAAFAVLPVLLLGAGCRGDAAPSTPEAPNGSVEQQFNDVESTLDAIESELADD